MPRFSLRTLIVVMLLGGPWLISNVGAVYDPRQAELAAMCLVMVVLITSIAAPICFLRDWVRRRNPRTDQPLPNLRFSLGTLVLLMSVGGPALAVLWWSRWGIVLAGLLLIGWSVTKILFFFHFIAGKLSERLITSVPRRCGKRLPD